MITVDDIMLPMIQNGFTPSSRPENYIPQAPRFIDYDNRRCCALGSLTLGANLQGSFAHYHTPGLVQALAKHYNVSVIEILSIEGGFEGWVIGSGRSQEAYEIGRKAFEAMVNVPLERKEELVNTGD